MLIPIAALNFVFRQKHGQPGVIANMIRREDTEERGILLIANAAGAKEIIEALDEAGMHSTVEALRAALAQNAAKPGVQPGVKFLYPDATVQ